MYCNKSMKNTITKIPKSISFQMLWITLLVSFVMTPYVKQRNISTLSRIQVLVPTHTYTCT